MKFVASSTSAIRSALPIFPMLSTTVEAYGAAGFEPGENSRRARRDYSDRPQDANGPKHARVVVGDAPSDAERSESLVRQAVEAMSGIAKSSGQISRIIGVIDEIAFQAST